MTAIIREAESSEGDAQKAAGHQHLTVSVVSDTADLPENCHFHSAVTRGLDPKACDVLTLECQNHTPSPHFSEGYSENHSSPKLSPHPAAGPLRSKCSRARKWMCEDPCPV